MLISSPPVAFPCYFGIDTPSHDQLIGSQHSVDEICRIIGADSLHYLSKEDMLKTVEGQDATSARDALTENILSISPRSANGRRSWI